MKDYTYLFSKLAKKAKPSVVRELLKLIDKPQIISFAGGLPSADEFPKDDIAQILKDIVLEHSHTALQYGTTEGSKVFRQEICSWLKEQEDIDITMDNLVVTSASQQALDMIGRLFISPGDDIVVTNPTYLGALQVFHACEAAMHGADTDEQGLIPASLESTLKKLKDAGKQCKFIYLVPDFQNPTGVTIPQERRVEILDIAKKYKTIIIEDSPYRQIRFEGDAPQTFLKLDNNEGNVVTLFTFSKILSPGFRLGYVAGPAQIIRNLVVLKQTMDLCSPSLLQQAAAKYMSMGLLAPHIKHVTDVYKVKRSTMLEALKKHMPKGISWTKPQGGLFLWITLPDYMDSEQIFENAIEENVAYVPGSVFYCEGDVKNNIRINFSYATLPDIEEGVKRLAKAIEKNIQ
ncbi:2-aminoadipate transaminase [Elusimicrobium posterum]|uniref:aminotransferase-like domain-containing protein n=1 Tax=Elusimicrobium posterum TaxID=3116653 RepID=UPI003C78FBF1